MREAGGGSELLGENALLGKSYGTSVSYTHLDVYKRQQVQIHTKVFCWIMSCIQVKREIFIIMSISRIVMMEVSHMLYSLHFQVMKDCTFKA